MTSRTYLYCLVRDHRAPTLDEAPQGVPGAGPLRALAVAEALWLVVAEVPAEEYDEAAITAGLDDLSWVSERALGHERVIEHLNEPVSGEPSRALLPLKLFTLFDSDDRARRWAATEAPRLESRLDRLAGRVEVGVRVTWSPAGAASEPAAAAATSGTDFLRTKQRRRSERRQRAEAAVAAAGEAFEALAGAAEIARRRPLPPEAGGLVLDAVFLLEAGGVTAFEQRADEVARRFADAGCELTLTGPWPPYHFVEEQG